MPPLDSNLAMVTGHEQKISLSLDMVLRIVRYARQTDRHIIN